jgi:RNA polymerase sigma factor (sigma-70 family)
VNDSLIELLAGCASGDEDAIEALVGRFQPWALSFAAALLDDKSAAADIVQESFVTALGKLHSLRDPDAFPGWFRQIIRTQVSRANRRRTECPLDEGREPVSGRPSPREEVDRRRFSAIVRSAVAALPPASRVTAELYYFDEMKQSEIATQLGLPRGTVRRRLHDARCSLRMMLAGLVEEPRQANSHPEEPFARNHNEDNKRRL